jgi:hypothetical protein
MGKKRWRQRGNRNANMARKRARLKRKAARREAAATGNPVGKLPEINPIAAEKKRQAAKTTEHITVDTNDTNDTGQPNQPQQEPQPRTAQEIAAEVIPEKPTRSDLALVGRATVWNVREDVKKALVERNAAFGLGAMGPGHTYNEQLKAYRQGTGPIPDGRLAMAAGQLCDRAVRNTILMEQQNIRQGQTVIQQHKHLHLHGGVETDGPQETPQERASRVLAMIGVERRKRLRQLERGEIRPPEPIVAEPEQPIDVSVDSPAPSVSMPSSEPSQSMASDYGDGEADLRSLGDEAIGPDDYMLDQIDGFVDEYGDEDEFDAQADDI